MKNTRDAFVICNRWHLFNFMSVVANNGFTTDEDIDKELVSDFSCLDRQNFSMILFQIFDFIKDANKVSQLGPVSWNTALKFLRARKFNTQAALELLDIYQVCLLFLIVWKMLIL